jgi:hypothetical protein
VATTKLTSRSCTTTLHNLVYVLNIEEEVVLESNNNGTLNPRVRIVTVTNFDSVSVSPCVSVMPPKLGNGFT